MKTTFKILAVAATALAVAGCSDQEAGSQIDNGYFGNATMQNMTAQMCAGRAKGYIVPDAVVVVDPSSTPAAPRYVRASLRCSGHLEGRYAQVIVSAAPDES